MYHTSIRACDSMHYQYMTKHGDTTWGRGTCIGELGVGTGDDKE